MTSRPGAGRLLLSLLFLLLPATVTAQQLGPSTGGLVALDQGLRFLGHDVRVLMVGAHPDDEDSEFLTVMARGYGAETAYLALTRGEGGQNLIGSELGPALGVLRTEELLAARNLDGARQFFTRAFDFGFSKGLPDTWRFWPRDSVLKDVVRVVRQFRPQVMVAVFSGTPRDGHGQHQASGWAAREAFAAAGDPSRFPELLTEEGLAPWTPLKLYQSARFDSAQGTVALEGGVLDRAVGQSYLQIAMRGRSMHRSQDMGSLQRIGPSTVRLRLIEDRTGAGGTPLLAGIDTVLAGAVRIGLGDDPAPLRAARTALESQAEGVRSVAVRDQISRIDDVLFMVSGVLCDATADAERLVPGRTVEITLTCWNSSAVPRVVRAMLVHEGTPRGGFDGRRLNPGEMAAMTVRLPVSEDTPLTQPYYLEFPPAGALYHWPAERRSWWSRPFERPGLVAEFRLEGGGLLRREVTYRDVDQGLGEIRRPVRIVPRVGVSLSPGAGLWASDGREPRQFVVTLRHAAPDTTAGTVQLDVPPGWEVSPPQRFTLAGEAAQQFGFSIRPRPGAPGRYQVRAVAVDGAGRRYQAGVRTVEYPHTRPRQLLESATAAIVVAPLNLPSGIRVGYVRGAADRVPEALEALGQPVTLLGADSLAGGDLAAFQAIVIGPRAYEVEPALAAANARLLDFVRAGGTLVVQYQQQVYFRGGFAPAPLALTAAVGDPIPFRIAAPRVAEEDAPVTVLAPEHPVFNQPNRLGPEDWSGWVQERGLYFARSWDPAWTPLLEMADTGEDALRGGLLVTRLGRGLYVYSGLSFFRQLPAAVPGPSRLFINLLGLRARAGVP